MTQPDPSPPPAPQARAHAVSWDVRGEYTRVRCTCRWAFQTPDFAAARRAAGEHLEAHPTPPTTPITRDAGPAPWPTAATPVAAPDARAATVRELATAAVEVNHLSRYGHVTPTHVNEDVTAVLALTGEHERAAVLTARHRGYAACLRAVLEEIDDLAGHDPAAVLAHLRQAVRERIESWEERP